MRSVTLPSHRLDLQRQARRLLSLLHLCHFRARRRHLLPARSQEGNGKAVRQRTRVREGRFARIGLNLCRIAFIRSALTCVCVQIINSDNGKLSATSETLFYPQHLNEILFFIVQKKCDLKNV